MREIRVGYIGAGSNTRLRHLPGFAAIDGVIQEVVANRSEASSREVAKAFGIRRVAKDWKEVVSDPSVDAVCIGTWPYLHRDATLAALENGKHVLCEARMAMNLDEAREMLRASRTHPDLILQIVPAPFTLTYDRKITELLHTGALGKLREIVVTHANGAHLDEESPMSWRQDVAKSGQNILTMGIFQETIHRWMGKNPLWLSAHGTTAVARRVNPETGEMATVRIPDALAVLGQYTSEAHFHYRFSSLQSGPERMRIQLNGSKGSLTFDGLNASLTFWRVGADQPESIEAEASADWNVEADFIQSVRNSEPARLTSPEAGVAYMEFTDAVHRSLNSQGARVPVPSSIEC